MPLLPEIELLISCASTTLEPERIEKIHRLLSAGNFQWEKVLRLARNHGLLPILYSCFMKTSRGFVPQDILDLLRAGFYAQTRRSLFLTRELLNILDLFERNGILVIPFKGPALGASVYGDITLRPFGDLDLVVRRKDLPRAKGLIISQGYRWCFDLTGGREEEFLRSEEGCFMTRRDGKVVVEIESEITPREFPMGLEMAPFWSRVRQVPFEGREILAFSPEDLFLILCLHGSKHGWERLAWVCDLAELIRRERGLDWEKICGEARKTGCERILRLAVSLISFLFSPPIPPEVLKKAREDPAVQSLMEKVLSPFRKESVDPLPGGWPLTSYYLRLAERRRDRAAFVLRLAFTPSVLDWESCPLPSSLSFLYYFLHPLRLAGKYGWDIGRSLLPQAEKLLL